MAKYSEITLKRTLTKDRTFYDWADSIRIELLGCTMPPPDAGIPITTDERNLILSWIRCGTPRGAVTRSVSRGTGPAARAAGSGARAQT